VPQHLSINSLRTRSLCILLFHMLGGPGTTVSGVPFFLLVPMQRFSYNVIHFPLHIGTTYCTAEVSWLSMPY
jgi:hypothetical protein